MTKGSRRQKITQIVYRHAARNGIHLISFANVGNHLHLHLQLMYWKTVNIKGQKKRLNHRGLYNRFIRGLTGAIALTMLTGAPANSDFASSAAKRTTNGRFWDQRPFTRYVATTRHFINMKDYLEVNRLEGQGFHHINARLEIAFRYDRKHPPDFDDI